MSSAELQASHKPSVLVFEISTNWGGIESFVENEIAPLQDEFDVYCVAQNDDPAIRERLSIPPDHVITLSEAYGSAEYRKHLKEIYSRNFDIIHFNKNSLIKFIPITMAERYAKQSKIVIHSHNTSPSSKSPIAFLHHVVRPFVVKKADETIACSTLAAQYLFGNTQAAQATIVANGIDVERFQFNEDDRREIRESLRIPEDAVVLINVGRFSAQKNQTRLIHMFAKYVQQDPTARLILVGDGDTRPEIEAAIEECRVRNNVLLVGKQSQVAKYYSAADLAVFPSIYEGLPVAMIEAQANGIPLLVSDVVTGEVNIAGDIAVESLQANDEQWAARIAEMTKAPRSAARRLRAAEQMRDAGYDQHDASEALRAVYHKLLATS